MGLKRKDVIQKCLLCNQGLMHNQWNPTFFRVTLERHIVDMQAVSRQAGLEQFFGGSPGAVAVASVMGPDEDMSKPMGAIPTFLICGDCAGTGCDPEDVEAHAKHTIDAMASMAQEQERPDDEDQTG